MSSAVIAIFRGSEQEDDITDEKWIVRLSLVAERHFSANKQSLWSGAKSLVASLGRDS